MAESHPEEKANQEIASEVAVVHEEAREEPNHLNAKKMEEEALDDGRVIAS